MCGEGTANPYLLSRKPSDSHRTVLTILSSDQSGRLRVFSLVTTEPPLRQAYTAKRGLRAASPFGKELHGDAARDRDGVVWAGRLWRGGEAEVIRGTGD